MAKYIAHNTVINYDADGMPTWTPIVGVGDIGGPEHSAEVIDVTSHDSNWRREYLTGVVDSGELSFPVRWDPAATSHAWLKTNIGVAKSFQVIWPDTGSTTWTFSGIVTKLSPKAPVDDKLEMEVTIKVTGAITES